MVTVNRGTSTRLNVATTVAVFRITDCIYLIFYTLLTINVMIVFASTMITRPTIAMMIVERADPVAFGSPLDVMKWMPAMIMIITAAIPATIARMFVALTIIPLLPVRGSLEEA